MRYSDQHEKGGTQPKTALRWIIPVILALVVGAVALFIFTGCGDDVDRRIINLPTVPLPPDEGDTVTCHDWRGEHQDRTVRRDVAETQPNFCFVGDVCFYRCPRR